MSDRAVSVLLLNPAESPGQARAAMTGTLLPACEGMFTRGAKRVKVTAEEIEDPRSEEQQGYYWGVVLRDVSEGVAVGGQRYTNDAWHEYGKRTFLPRKTKKVRVAGRTRPVVTTVIASTNDLSVRQMGEYLEKWIAFAAEHGVQVSEPLPPHLRPQRRVKKQQEHIDAETGEITEATA